MQAYPCGIVMHVLTTCFHCAPIVLNANTLRVTFHLFYRTIYASIKCGKINETPSQVRVFALAGAIGIEPTQWESEAQVLPLHQAPSRELLYITKDCFAIDFLCRNKKITAQMIFFEIIDLFLLQKCANCCILQRQSDLLNLFCKILSGCSAVWFAIRAETKRAKYQE